VPTLSRRGDGPRQQGPRRVGPRRADQTRDIDAIARRLALNIYYLPAMRNGEGREDRGNAILSTVPLTDPVAIELPFERQRRVAAAVSAEVTTERAGIQRLRLVSTHFETSLALGRGGPSAARLRQAVALVDALAQTTTPADRATIVGGDLNTSWGSDEPAVRYLRKMFPDGRGPAAGATWRGPYGSGAQLDYVLIRDPRGPAEVQRGRQRYGSDHHPLITVVRVDP
jgi:endonuclease/exonuclease/phosphatase family metal-dependent hydrolase